MRFWLTALVIVVADQISKWAVNAHFSAGESITVLRHLLMLTYVQNHGAAFGLFPGKIGFLMLSSSLVVLAAIIMNLRGKLPGILQLLTGLIAGGAMGNLIDRVIRGYVVDFLDLGWWPVFNIADSAIFCAVILMIVYTFQEERNEVQRG